jgi:branched-chain amino acid transport system substrate-binding protein
MESIGSTSDKGPIKIGLVTTLTGPAAFGGNDMVKGLKLCLELCNYQIAGRKVELIVEDDQHSGTTAISRVKKLVEQDGVHIINGTIAANIAYAIAPVLDMLHVPAVFPVTAADDLTKRKRYKSIIRTGFSASQIGLPFGEFAYQKLGYKRISAIGLDYAFGWEVIGAFQKTFEQAGGKIIQKIWTTQGMSNVQARVKEIKPDADCVFFATSNLGADIVASQYFAHGPKLPIIGGGPGFDEIVLRDIGDNAIGAISVSHYSGALETPANAAFKKALRTKYGEEVPPSMFSEGAYTSGLWMKKAIESIHGKVEDHDALLEALRNVRLPDAPRGPMQLDEYGNPIQNIYVRRVEKVQDRLQNTVVATIPAVSQFWKYDPVKFMQEPAFTREFAST